MSQSIVKTFNTFGPCVAEEHYMLPTLARQPKIDSLIEGKRYFILHAPRQSGKTTFLEALTDKINSEGKYYALTCSLMGLRSKFDENLAISTIIDILNFFMKESKVTAIEEKAYLYNSLPGIDDCSSKISIFLNTLCEDLDKELILFLDEADCLSGPGLLSFLTQIRNFYQIRHQPGNKFPRSLGLVGLRDIRDYQVTKGEEVKGPPPSPFNIKSRSLTLSNFTFEDIGILYRQHTEAVGQVFADSAIDRVWYWSEGQPWLVNALAKETIEEILQNDLSTKITGLLINQAAENLIKLRDVHIDSFLEKLKEPRVARVINGVIAGASLKGSEYIDDRKYCLDLGLVALDKKKCLRPANAIYQEIISRTLTDTVQELLDENIERITWNDGQIVFISAVLRKFQDFWRENAFTFPFRINETQIQSFLVEIDNLPNKALIKEILELVSKKYDEAAYVIILMAFLQRVVNGGALVHRQFAEGRGAVDLRITFKDRKYLIECKIKGNLSEEDSIDQLAGYLDTAGEKEGWLVIFDRDRDKSWDDKITWDTTSHKGHTIYIVRC
ncbi:MAG: AAA-like domain-containing protein [Deltaproteobacteria bacterium]|nr:AAA-like domain-containing protein [Deltaproteobacteria bacterium]